MDATRKLIRVHHDRKRDRAYKRLDSVRARIKRERITMLFHGEESFAGFLAGVHLENLSVQRTDLLNFLDSED